MSASRLEWKVGLFVFIGLTLLCLLLLEFSKGAAFFSSTYEISLLTPNAGGIKPRSAVLMAGLPIGNVVDSAFTPDNKNVSIRLKIYKKYPIATNAAIAIDQSGFLGDQFISITPSSIPAPAYLDGAVVRCDSPLNILEAARSAMGLMAGVNKLVSTLDEMLKKVDRIVLAEQSLQNFTNSLASFRTVPDRINLLVGNVDQLIQSNRPALESGLYNTALAASNINRTATGLDRIIETNRDDLRVTVSNLAILTDKSKELLGDIQEGRGLAGNLLKNEQTSREFSMAISNLSLLGSNLNRYGLLYKPKQAKVPLGTNSAVKGLFGRDNLR
jgi:phospholipid/cholesterol/gamma-HCH transport system substrate-binding protein